ncbi:MAG: hypothetical protein L6R19_26645 [Alphaproteobacteria bacterium]|nr:hypothetical protein [Alphaproteobacteria bacterium]
MKRTSRTLELFSLSALDLFASAMGVFVLIVVILFPYFQKSAPELREIESLRARVNPLREQNELLREAVEALQGESERLRSDVQRLRQGEQLAQRLPQLQGENARLSQRAEALEERLKRTFLIVRIAWESAAADVDLHVVDPQGREFYWQRPNFNRSIYRDTPAELTLDATRAPGLEIFFHPEAEAGIYRIFYNLYGEGGPPASAHVEGVVIHRNGRIEIPARTLTLRRGASGRPWLAATGGDRPALSVVVTADGNVRTN